MTVYLGIDTSTTATKALLIDAAGDVLGVGKAEYDYATPRPGWSEQDPNLWWRGTIKAIHEAVATSDIDPSSVAAIGVTGQMHGLVALDASDRSIRPSILWNDQRTTAQCDEIRKRVGRDRLIAITGNDALTGFTAPKILWMRDEEPENYARISTVLLPKDYLRLRLTGEHAVDRAGASGTLLFDLERRDWSDEIIESLGLPRDWFPQTFEGIDITGYLTDEAASLTGLRPGTPVVGGAGDQAANGVGTGAVEPGTVAVSLGTSGVVFAATDRPVIDPDARLHSFCHAVPGLWHQMGVMLSAAGSLRWFRDTIGSDVSFAELSLEAGGIAPGSDGLLFLPYLTGERTPHPDPEARGAFVGLTVRHTRAHLTRAVMEGVAFGLRDSLEIIRQQSDVGEIRVAGGGAASPVWLQILADVFGAEVRTVDVLESAAFGAALLAMVGDGTYETVGDAVAATIRTGEEYQPGSSAARYDEMYETYRSLYPALRDVSHRLGNFEQVSPG
ncbi:MAG: xylulokinase [Actinomycetota bacterium]|nr:xylulokinase [Actinomycetota bacterium]